MKKAKELALLILVLFLLSNFGSEYAYAAELTSNLYMESIKDGGTEGYSDTNENYLPILNYLVIMDQQIVEDEKETIVINVSDDNTINSAIITLSNKEKNILLQYNAKIINKGTLQFETDCASELEQGEYYISSLELLLNDGNYLINMNETGVDACFGVEIDVETTPNAYIVNDDTINISPEILENQTNDIIDFSIEKSTYYSNGKTVIVIDPGHGGSDPGASCEHDGVSYYERDIVLKIAQYCKAKLEESDQLEVYLTRNDNSSPLMTRKERLEFAQNHSANILVSLHLNSLTGQIQTTAKGAEVWVPNENYNNRVHEISVETGEKIMEELIDLGLINRGSAKIRNDYDEQYPDGSVADYYGINYYGKLMGIPAIIVEHCFIDSAEDFSLVLNDEDKLKELGEADAEGIIKALPSISQKDSIFSPIFDARYYADKYLDLKAAFGYNYDYLLSHYLNKGVYEGRQACDNFDVVSYWKRYSDLRKSFGNDYYKLAMHYLYYGQNEGRVGTYCNKLLGATSVYNGVDYSAVYDYNYYSNYRDIKNYYGENEYAILEHFVLYGMKEGRQGNETFSLNSYKLQYPDLRHAFKNSNEAYYYHYISFGRNESRDGIGCTTLQGASTKYNGVDYSCVYNYNYYKEYADIRKAFGDDDEAMLEHFVIYGMKEGRRGINSFDVNSYKLQYPDLRRAFGSDIRMYYYHYITYGKKEGRDGVGCNTLQGAITKYNGIDYSPIYDYEYYKTYRDLYKAYGEDDEAMLEHFVIYGMREGRVGNTQFNVYNYRSKYRDLQNSFGDSIIAYYYHYLQFGMSEGRTA